MPTYWKRRNENVHNGMRAILTLGRNSPSPLPCFAISSLSNKHGGLKLSFDDSYIMGYNVVQTSNKSTTSQRRLLSVFTVIQDYWTLSTRATRFSIASVTIYQYTRRQSRGPESSSLPISWLQISNLNILFRPIYDRIHDEMDFTEKKKQ
jgi:hypothetical protein